MSSLFILLFRVVFSLFRDEKTKGKKTEIIVFSQWQNEITKLRKPATMIHVHSTLLLYVYTYFNGIHILELALNLVR